jgi:hypothetical protein
VQKGSALALACRPPLVFSGVWRSRPPGGGSLWGPGLGPLYALEKQVRACASSPKISWGGHQILPRSSRGGLAAKHLVKARLPAGHNAR